jgi:hypothetical protein
MKTALDTLMEALEADTWTPHGSLSDPTTRKTENRENRLQAERSPLPSKSNAQCGSPQCSGCYEVAPGVRIHPPEVGQDYLDWLKEWEARGRVQ